MMSETQAVVDATNTPATPGAAVNDARNDGDDLDTLLKAYETEVPASPQTPEPKPGATPDQNTLAELKSIVSEAKGVVTEAQSVRFRQDMDRTIKDVRGELDPDIFDDRLVEAWLNAKAAEDPRLADAWVKRSANPKQFDRVKQQLGKDFSKKFSKLPDKGATEDREIVTAAVRGASTKAPEGKAPDFKEMSDAEYRETVRKEYGFSPL
jgi:hypothetical protein